jgi:hypothetical protein
MAHFSKRQALWLFVRALLPGPKLWLQMVAGLSFIMAIAFASSSAMNPWAYSIWFGPVLPGTWVGEMTPAVGGRHIVLVRLRAEIGEGDDDLTGTVTLCSQREGLHDFGLTGHTNNWRGTAFTLTSFITERRDGAGVQIGTTEGRWDGRDEIRVNAHLRLFRIKNGGSISTYPPSGEQAAVEDAPVAFALRRSSADELTSACRSLER